MNVNRLKRFLFFLVLLTGNASAQLLDESRAPSTIISPDPDFSHQYRFLNKDRYYFIDTTFRNLQWYHQWNNADRDLMDYSVLGNMGSAHNKLTYRTPQDIWSYYSLKAYNLYFNSIETIPFYYTRSPLTEARYWMGYNRGQSFKIYHTQNINKYWNFLVQYKRLNSLGFYNHNNNKQSNFLINSRYDNPQLGYTVSGYFISEKLDIEEFGGIANDTLFTDNIEPNRILLNVNLPNDMRIMRNREFYLDQRIKLARLLNKVTDNADSIKSQEQSVDKAFLALGYNIKYNRRSDVYKGVANGYYDDYFYSEDDYRDSSSYSSLTNTLYIEAEVGERSKLAIRGGVRNLLMEYAGENFRFISNNWGITGDLQGKIKEYVDINGTVDYILAGPLNNSIDIKGKGKIKVYKDINAFGSYRYQLRSPDFYKQFYYSNNFIWQNDFEKESTGILQYGLGWGLGNKLEIANYTFTNFTYFNNEGYSAQSGPVIRLNRIELVQNFTLWDFIHQDNNIYYQTTTDANGVLPLPEWVSRNSLYFEFPLFKGALQCLWGAEVKYFSAYQSPAFNPATGTFYVTKEMRSIGNYPLIDLFANFKIQKAKIFVKYEHASQGLFDYSYFAAPLYPFPDRVLRVGISWRFFN